ncbi:MAG: hypothetical protein OJF59_002390 [Cytophagales bacterium]|jgi:hypothetical protein|nr:hypothetical protein [Bacteroidota bacterium]MBS1980127.1 hypothetical protein [Bacteroidota bacterium]WHZ08636.1 MAG: hypothetical protein OJF59_002390 [Cytophagales bacterium]
MEKIGISLKSKKLQSGRIQVGFSTEAYYGYLLTEPMTSVADVVNKINRHLKAITNTERYFQRNLFSFENRKKNTNRILIFKK